MMASHKTLKLEVAPTELEQIDTEIASLETTIRDEGRQLRTLHDEAQELLAVIQHRRHEEAHIGTADDVSELGTAIGAALARKAVLDELFRIANHRRDAHSEELTKMKERRGRIVADSFASLRFARDQRLWIERHLVRERKDLEAQLEDLTNRENFARKSIDEAESKAKRLAPEIELELQRLKLSPNV